MPDSSQDRFRHRGCISPASSPQVLQVSFGPGPAFTAETRHRTASHCGCPHRVPEVLPYPLRKFDSLQSRYPLPNLIINENIHYATATCARYLLQHGGRKYGQIACVARAITSCFLGTGNFVLFSIDSIASAASAPVSAKTPPTGLLHQSFLSCHSHCFLQVSHTLFSTNLGVCSVTTIFVPLSVIIVKGSGIFHPNLSNSSAIIEIGPLAFFHELPSSA